MAVGKRVSSSCLLIAVQNDVRFRIDEDQLMFDPVLVQFIQFTQKGIKLAAGTAVDYDGRVLGLSFTLQLGYRQ